MAGESLSLQEKMVLIRAKIPALVKRAYSEDVNYDFTKIDDVFRYLTPAMNEYKVNWEIEEEKATLKDELGNPIFVRYIDKVMMWMYEADLRIRWINAENPDDNTSVTLHAIGTHELPEKAKGSGWTYALKYYLLDKYGIDQGAEDPDMRSFKDGAGDEAEQADKLSAEYPDKNGDEKTVPDVLQPDITINKDALRSDMKENTLLRQDSDLIRPEHGQMVSLPESAVTDASGGSESMTFEEACQLVCTFGTHKGVQLGDMARQGADGISTLEWIAYEYRGRNEKLREGARLLLQAVA